MAGLAYFLGLTRIGATVIRGGSSSVAFLVELIKNCRPNAIVGVPTLLLAVGEKLRAEGIDPAMLGVTRLVCIGEPIRNKDFTLSPLGERLDLAWRCQLFGTYASTEMATSFTDCSAGRGGHLLPELIVVEIVDEQGEAVPPGRFGEVVATPLGISGMPLLRFRTGDIATLHSEPCPCGRNTPRLGPVVGRKSQMLKIRGTTVYPPAIAAVLQGTARGSGLLHRGAERVHPLGPDPCRDRLHGPGAHHLLRRRPDCRRHSRPARGRDRLPGGDPPGDRAGRQAQTGHLLRPSHPLTDPPVAY